MYITQNRTRSIQLIVRVTPEEKEFINKKMELCNAGNFNAFARKMLINGYIVNVNLEKFNLLAKEINSIGNNINQIAKISNTTGMVFGDDINKLKEMVDEIWRLLKSSLSELLSKSR